MRMVEDVVPPYAERWTDGRRLLCLAVKSVRSPEEEQTIRCLYAQVGADEMARIAAANRAESIVAHGLADAGIVGPPWDGWHTQWQARIGRMMHLLDDLASAAAAQGIPVVALKNGAIARALHPCPACVPMGDLDLLVRRQDFAHMHGLMKAMGFRGIGDRHGDLGAGLARGGLDYRLEADGTTYAIDLQWRPVSGHWGWLRADQEPSADELIERSLLIPGSAARMLAPVDNLVHVALHTAKHSYCRPPGFRLHLDVERVVHGSTVDWSGVVVEARRLGVAAAIFLGLAVPRGLFATPVPEWVLRTLDPGDARRRLLYRWLARASVFDPDRPKFTRVAQLAFHAALADDPMSLWRTIFPSAAEMRERYQAGEGRSALFVGYGRRFADILLRYHAG